ncbi:MAG: fatty acid amide hydrolase 2 [Pseudonocardiales bacterium]|nr:fatty acid amide hydrolase 2 [Pseudonocardiales bacterium]
MSEQLTHLSATELAARIRDGRTTSTEVVEAHIAVLNRIGHLHALAVERFDLAREEAKAADARIADGETDLPPLHGVPMTVKEMFGVEGMPNTGGYPHRRKFRPSADAPIVARMREAGAIILGLGNTCGFLIWMESNNPLYGRASCAYDADRTAGGSSGGDSAIVGSGGAPIALGSDLGGSIRMPAFFNGVFGHLPSPGLVPLTGHFPMPDGELRRRLSPGPLTRRSEDLLPVLRIIAGPDGEDPYVEDLPLGDAADVSIGGMSVVVATHASTVPLRAVLRDAIDRAADGLAERGAHVRRAPFKEMRWALAQFGATVATEIDLLNSWQKVTASTRPGARADRAPLAVRGPAALLKVVESAPVRTVRTRAARRLVDSAQRAQDTLGETIGDGVLLYPPFPRLVPKHRHTLGQPWLATNTAIFNLYGLPTTQVPLGLGNKGLPLGVQVVAGAGRDHVSIAVAAELENLFGGWVDPADVGRD